MDKFLLVSILVLAFAVPFASFPLEQYYVAEDSIEVGYGYSGGSVAVPLYYGGCSYSYC
jgi:hypothetical protein